MRTVSSVQREHDRIPGYAINGLRRFTSQTQFHSEAEEWEYVCQQVKRRERIAAAGGAATLLRTDDDSAPRNKGVVWDPRDSDLPQHEQLRRDAIAYALDGGKTGKKKGKTKVSSHTTAA